MNRAYLKPFVAWGTGFVRRYKTDVFYRTSWNIVLLQIGLTLFMLTIAWLAILALYQDIVFSIIGTFSEALHSGNFTTLDGTMLAEDLEYTKNKNLILLGTSILMIKVVFGYLVAKLALTPTRNALENQKQFVGNIAHELRTPLAILKTNMEVDLLKPSLSAEEKKNIESNIEELNRISNIINNLLSMNRLLRPEKIVFEEVNINKVITQSIGLLSHLAKRRGVQVEVTHEAETAIYGNPQGLEQIITNILKNAINHSPSGSTVTIEAHSIVMGRVEITITDTGTGIPEKDLERIFEPFYRGNKARTRMSGTGSGLGLAIVSELMKLHRGKIQIASEEGKGTEVTLTFPSAKAKSADVAGPKEVFVDFLKKG